jgi:LPXTG-motif cell wall-anchored protein
LDPGEPPLPGVPVTLTIGVNGSAWRVGIAAASRSATTGADGQYRFDNVEAGTYVVTASVAATGFRYTSDTDGLADWVVDVQVSGADTADASFAGVGDGQLEGTVYDSTTLAPIGAATVRCHWAGFDDIPGTADDTVITAVANAQGAFVITDTPYGRYTCSANNPATGAASTPAAATVESPDPTHVDLPIITEAPRPPDVLPPNEGVVGMLPQTGPRTGWLLALAVGLLLTGAGALRLGRRRKG